MVNKIVSIIKSLYDLNKDDESIYLPSDIISIIDNNPSIIEDLVNDGDIINFIEKSRVKYYKELELLIEASEEQTDVLCKLESEAQEKQKLHLIVQEKNKILEKNLEVEKSFNLITEKQSRIFKIVQWLILILILIISIFGVNMIFNNDTKSTDHFKDIVLIIIGLCSGSISTFIGTSRLDRNRKEEL